MDCNNVKNMINEYIDNELDIEDMEKVKDHLAHCSQCAGLYEELEKIKEVIKEDENFVPDDFSKKVINKIKEEKKGNIFVFKKSYMAVAAVFLVAIIAIPNIPNLLGNYSKEESAISSDMVGTTEMMNTMAPTISPQEPSMQSSDGKSITEDRSSNQSGIESERVQIKSYYLNLEVKDIESVFENIQTITNTYGGYIENSNMGDYYVGYYQGYDTQVNIRNAYLNLRLPVEKVSEVSKMVEALGEVSSKGENTSDITQYYQDINSELENYKATRVRMLELLAKVGSLTETLEVEKELSRIQLEINRLESSIKQTNNQVTFTYYSINLIELDETLTGIKPLDESIFEKISEAFFKNTNKTIDLLVNSLVFVISIIPMAILILVIYLVFKKPIRSLIGRFKK
jgi:negative regulator of sigma E activity